MYLFNPKPCFVVQPSEDLPLGFNIANLTQQDQCKTWTNCVKNLVTFLNSACMFSGHFRMSWTEEFYLTFFDSAVPVSCCWKAGQIFAFLLSIQSSTILHLTKLHRTHIKCDWTNCSRDCTCCLVQITLSQSVLS